jgi:hypothetical protein
MSDTCRIALFFLALATYRELCIRLARTKATTGLLGFLNKIRSALAYEGWPPP